MAVCYTAVSGHCCLLRWNDCVLENKWTKYKKWKYLFPVNCYNFLKVWLLSRQMTMILMYLSCKTLSEYAFEDDDIKNKMLSGVRKLDHKILQNIFQP